MKLIIKHPFEIDVELVDYKPNCLLVKFNWVKNQIIDVSLNEMQTLISFLKFSSTEFRDAISDNNIQLIDSYLPEEILSSEELKSKAYKILGIQKELGELKESSIIQIGRAHV